MAHQLFEPDLQNRRAVILASLAGIASMGAVTLLQTGIIKHLPDPPLGNFDSDRVNLSDNVFRFGLPDGPVSLASLALNIPIAAFGGADRTRRHPWLPLFAAAKAGEETLVAGGIITRCPPRKGMVRLLYRRGSGEFRDRRPDDPRSLCRVVATQTGARLRSVMPAGLSGLLVIGELCLLGVLELRRPVRREVEPKLPRVARNLAFSLLAAVTVRAAETRWCNRCRVWSSAAASAFSNVFRYRPRSRRCWPSS